MIRKWKRTGALFVLLPAIALAACRAPNIGLIYASPKFERFPRNAGDPQRRDQRAILENGGCVVVLPQTRTPEQVALLLEGVEGILVPGGIDVDPKFYGETRHPKLERTDAGLDEHERAVLDWSAAHGLPVFGICRGHQVLNVYHGGSLVQDIPAQHRSATPVAHRFPRDSKEPREHAVSVEKGTVFHELFGEDRLVVNTYHHQAVKRLAPGFRVSARTDDGLAEAIEHEGQRYVLGVQFHPEMLRNSDGRFNAFFERFIEEVGRASR